MLFSRNGWWMMSSSSAIRSAPAHPEAAQNEPAAIDEGHPQRERFADEEIANQRQYGDAKADRDKRVAEPQASDRIKQHEIDRPERSLLAGREVAENDHAEKSECEGQQQRRQHSHIEAADAGSGTIVGADRARTSDRRDIDRDPRIAGAPRRQPGRKVARKHQHAP